MLQWVFRPADVHDVMDDDAVSTRQRGDPIHPHLCNGTLNPYELPNQHSHETGKKLEAGQWDWPPEIPRDRPDTSPESLLKHTRLRSNPEHHRTMTDCRKHQ